MARLPRRFADKLRVPEGVRDVQVFDDSCPVSASGSSRAVRRLTLQLRSRRSTAPSSAWAGGAPATFRAMQFEASAILAKARLGTDVVAIARADAARTLRRWPARSAVAANNAAVASARSAPVAGDGIAREAICGHAPR